MLCSGWIKKLALTAILCWMMPSVSMATIPRVAEVAIEIKTNSIVYPQLEGLEDEAIQRFINDDIAEKAGIAMHLVTVSALREGGWGLHITYESFLQNNLFSVVISAKGEMPNGREGQQYTALCYDLATGTALTPECIFTDAEAAIAWMEEQAEETLGEEVFGYLEKSSLVPFPAVNFSMDADGITFYYPFEQFAWLSGYSGACQFDYGELSDYIRWDELTALTGFAKPIYDDTQAREMIEQLCAQGRLPRIPTAIGDNMTEIIAQYRLMREPDLYPGGRYYQLEAPQFRRVQILTDALEKGYERSQVLGFQVMRGELFGIHIGVTSQERWREILGEPQSTVVFSQSLAYDYSLPAGKGDYYIFGSYQLRLYADGSGRLHSIRLSK